MSETEPGRSESREKPTNELTFREAKRERDKLSAVATKTPDQEKRLGEARNRMERLIQDVRNEGLLADVDDDLNAFRQRVDILQAMRDSGELRSEHILQFTGDAQDAISRARALTATEEENPHKGVREYVYAAGLRGIKDRAAHLSPTRGLPNNLGGPTKNEIPGIFDPESYAKAMGIPSAKEVEDMYRRAEAEMMQIQIPVGQEPKFFVGIEQREKDYWKARANLSSAAGFKKGSTSYDKLFPNDSMNGITAEDLKLLLTKQGGTWEALSLYVALVAGKAPGSNEVGLDPRRVLVENSNPGTEELARKKEALSTTCPTSIFDINNGEAFGALRESMILWLQTHNGLSRNEAADAEHIAWNLVYISNLVEQYDSFVYRPGIGAKIPPSVPPLKSLATWMMMHPQERLAAKVRANEAWSAFGEWALNLKKTSSNPDEFQIPSVLPDELFRNALNGIMLGESSLEKILRENGTVLAENPRNRGSRPDLEQLRETPFSGYSFDTIGPAVGIFNVIVKGEQKDRKITELGDAFRKLKESRGRPLTRREKEIVIMAWKGVKSNSKSLTPAIGNLAWGDYLRGLNKYAPNLFKD